MMRLFPVFLLFLLGFAFNQGFAQQEAPVAGYTGARVDGKKSGQGTYVWPNGNKYEGAFLNDTMHGQGVFEWANGEKYEGEYVNGGRTGEGTYSWPNGDKYIGHFEKDIRTGKGTYYYENGARYDGSWKNDKKHGNGIFTWSNGDRYDGRFENDVKNGYGNYFVTSPKASVTIRFCPRCKKYMGNWKDGAKEGFGRCYNKKGKVIYEGKFKKDKPAQRYPTRKKNLKPKK